MIEPLGPGVIKGRFSEKNQLSTPTGLVSYTEGRDGKGFQRNDIQDNTNRFDNSKGRFRGEGHEGPSRGVATVQTVPEVKH